MSHSIGNISDLRAVEVLEKKIRKNAIYIMRY